MSHRSYSLPQAIGQWKNKIWNLWLPSSFKTLWLNRNEPRVFRVKSHYISRVGKQMGNVRDCKSENTTYMYCPCSTQEIYGFLSALKYTWPRNNADGLLTRAADDYLSRLLVWSFFLSSLPLSFLFQLVACGPRGMWKRNAEYRWDRSQAPVFFPPRFSTSQRAIKCQSPRRDARTSYHGHPCKSTHVLRYCRVRRVRAM